MSIKLFAIIGQITTVLVAILAFLYTIVVLGGVFGSFAGEAMTRREIERFPVCRQVAQFGVWPKVNVIRDLPLEECKNPP